MLACASALLSVLILLWVAQELEDLEIRQQAGIRIDTAWQGTRRANVTVSD
jgi:hypothetical protein